MESALGWGSRSVLPPPPTAEPESFFVSEVNHVGCLYSRRSLGTTLSVLPKLNWINNALSWRGVD